MKKTVYRTSGASLVLYLVFDLIFLAIPFVSLPGLIHSFTNGDITYYIGDLASLFLVVYLTAHLTTNRIVLSDDSIEIKEADAKLFYKSRSLQTPFSGIKSVWLGGKSYLQDELKYNKQALTEVKKYYDRFETGRSVKKGKNAPVMPPILLVEKADGKYFIAGTRPYSKVQLKSIVDKLASNGVRTSVQKGTI